VGHEILILCCTCVVPETATTMIPAPDDVPADPTRIDATTLLNEIAVFRRFAEDIGALPEFPRRRLGHSDSDVDHGLIRPTCTN